MSNFSIVITCYNREKVVLKSIQSALKKSVEVIVVDDASSDKSFSVIQSVFYDKIRSGNLRLIKNETNLGVTGSKNIGFLAASKDFVGFLDSDDLLTETAMDLMQSEINEFDDCAIFFFRCRNQEGKYVGKRIESSKRIDLRFFLKNTTQGEVLTVINKKMVQKAPYHAYFRGYEGIGCARILENNFGLLSKEIVRVYDQQGQDRLSSPKIYKRRRKQIIIGHSIILRKYKNYMSSFTRFKYKLKIFSNAISFI